MGAELRTETSRNSVVTPRGAKETGMLGASGANAAAGTGTSTRQVVQVTPSPPHASQVNTPVRPVPSQVGQARAAGMRKGTTPAAAGGGAGCATATST